MGAPQCRDLEPLIHPYLDGEFEAVDQQERELHLATCAHCQAQVCAERALRTRLKVACAAIAPAALRARIEEGLYREKRLGALRRWARPELLAALAACAGFIAWLSGRSLFSPLLEDAVSRHTHQLPVEVRGDAAQLQRWFTGKVDFNVRLPALRNVNLEGARISHIRDHSAALVQYGGPREHRVSLFVFDDPRAPLELVGAGVRRTSIENHDVMLMQSRGYNVALWRDNEIVYSLVSDLDERDILELLRVREAANDPTEAPVNLPGAGTALRAGP
jgi:anti-sigma factor RsiW